MYPNPKNIAEALNKILDDKNLWNEFSENGIKNVKKYLYMGRPC